MATYRTKQSMADMLKRVINGQGSWEKHVNHTCGKCQNCNCGKHKCEIKSPHLFLTPSKSTYHKQYSKKKPVTQGNNRYNKSFDSYHPKQLVEKTQYKDDFNNKIKQSVVPKKQIYQDNLELGGPTFSTTTYQNSYIQVQGSPQSQIKNPESLGCSPGARMHTISNYRDTYKWHPKQKIKKQKPIVQQDNLKTQIGHFTGETSYSAYFHNFPKYKRDRSNFAPDRSFQSKKGLKLQTSYHEHYKYKTAQKCPAENYS